LKVPKNILKLEKYEVIFVCMEQDKRVIFVRPPKGSDLKERLTKLSVKLDRSLSYVAAKAIDEYLKKHKIK
jgi:predicted DNA-binding protein